MPKEFQQARYSLKNPKKYVGDPTNVFYRSSWERKFMIFLDCHESIIEWSSEEIVIPYYWEGDSKMHRYFPDFYASMKTNNGIVKMMIEVKPFVQTQEPKRTRGKREKTFINEVMTYSKNVAKWKAAEEYCKKRNMEFKLLTEKELFKNGKAW